MNVRDTLSSAVVKISKKWPETPLLDASVMLQKALDITKEKLLASFSTEIPLEALDRFNRMVEKRAKGYPVAYVTGKKEFYGHLFSVDERVLIPRADTEILVEKVINAAKTGFTEVLEKRELKILDLCTGTGCIAYALKSEITEAEIDGSDISDEALEVFRLNCKNLPSGLKINYIKSDLFDNIKQKYHIIASNPPYLTYSEYTGMAEAGWPEPEKALCGGIDGLDIVKKIAAGAAAVLYDHGMLCMEAAPGQMKNIETILIDNNFKNISVTKDLSGRDRVICGYKS